MSQQQPMVEPHAKRYYGWMIVAIATAGVFLSGPGQTVSVSAFIDPMIAEFGWSRTLISSLYSMGTLVAGLGMTGVGRLVDVYGYRRMFALIPVLFALGLLWMSWVQYPWMLFVGFLLIRSFGQGSLTLIPYSLVPQWFMTKRGRALSILAVGSAISSAVLPLINLAIIGAWGWRVTWQLWALILAGFLAPVAWFGVRERPEDMGLRMDGVRPTGPGDSSQDAALGMEMSWTREATIRTRAFWILLIATCIPSMVGTGAQFHHISIMAENGVTAGLAATVFTVAAGTQLLFTPLAGWACDNWSVKGVLVIGLVFQAAALLLLLWTRTFAGVVVLGIVQGARMGLVAVAGGVVWPQYFGRRYLASIRGVTTAGLVIASSLGPAPFGIGFDWFGGYREVILLMTLIPVVGAAGVMTLPSMAAMRKQYKKLHADG